MQQFQSNTSLGFAVLYVYDARIVKSEGTPKYQEILINFLGFFKYEIVLQNKASGTGFIPYDSHSSYFKPALRRASIKRFSSSWFFIGDVFAMFFTENSGSIFSTSNAASWASFFRPIKL